FNILGPLSNPASASCQVLGVYDRRLTLKMAEVLKKLGAKRAYIVHGRDGLDEVTITGKTYISELKNGVIRSFQVSPSDFGVRKASLNDIKGGSALNNARLIRGILSGKKGPRRDIVLMNAGLALMAAGKAGSFREGADLAEKTIDSGKAEEKLDQFIQFTNFKSGEKLK
ncbi:MAG: anthranilate phosphoribosyltransferase, partial [Candidatus Omnitrophota bacterium]